MYYLIDERYHNEKLTALQDVFVSEFDDQESAEFEKHDLLTHLTYSELKRRNIYILMENPYK